MSKGLQPGSGWPARDLSILLGVLAQWTRTSVAPPAEPRSTFSKLRAARAARKAQQAAGPLDGPAARQLPPMRKLVSTLWLATVVEALAVGGIVLTCDIVLICGTELVCGTASESLCNVVH